MAYAEQERRHVLMTRKAIDDGRNDAHQPLWILAVKAARKLGPDRLLKLEERLKNPGQERYSEDGLVGPRSHDGVERRHALKIRQAIDDGKNIDTLDPLWVVATETVRMLGSGELGPDMILKLNGGLRFPEHEERYSEKGIIAYRWRMLGRRPRTDPWLPRLLNAQSKGLPPEVLDLEIESFVLGKNTRSALRRAGIVSVKNFVTDSMEVLDSILGKAAANETHLALLRHGINWE